MGFLDSFERSLERAVGGAFAKTFRSGVHPTEIVSALKREMDAQAAIAAAGRMLAPRDYFVALASVDNERLDQLGEAFIDELRTALVDHVEHQGYYITGSPRISLRSDRSLSEGIVGAEAVVTKEPVVWIPTLEFNDRRFPVTARRTTIGRGSSADIVVDAKGVSREHCQIIWDGKRAEVADLGSTNGTELDGVAISRHPLPDRAVLGVGQARIVVAVVPQLEKDYQALTTSTGEPVPEDAS